MGKKKRRKMLFVYNPHSGRGEIAMALPDILLRLTGFGFDVTVHPTLAQGDGRDFIAEHAGEYEVVVTGGGDGMLHELFSGMMANGADLPCGYIPCGTVNDFASSLMISKNPIEAVETIINGKVKRIDAGTFNDGFFSYVAAFGLFTEASYSTDQNLKNVLGFAAYLIEIVKSIDIMHLDADSVHAVVKTGEVEYEGDFIFGFAGNTLSVGGLTNIVPSDAQMDDGLLDLMLVRTPGNLQELDMIRQAFMTHELDSPMILSFQTDRVQIITDKKTKWTLDGEYGGSFKCAEIGVARRAVKMLCP